MWILLVAIVLIGLKLGGIGPFEDLSWWWIGVPLGIVFVWWEIIDPMFGISSKRAMEAVERRKVDRNAKARQNLGLRGPRDGKGRH